MLNWELKKLKNNRWLLIVLIIVFCIWLFMMNIVIRAGEEDRMLRFYSYWHEVGSLVISCLILFINTRLFSMDNEQFAKEVILTTKFGKLRLLIIRLIATILYTIVLFLLLLVIQVGGYYFIFYSWPSIQLVYGVSLLVSLAGSVLFSLFAAVVCILVRKISSTAIICTFLFGVSFITRGESYSVWTTIGNLDKGYFSYLVRAQFVSKIQWQQMLGWYGLLFSVLFSIMIYLQVRRHEI